MASAPCPKYKGGRPKALTLPERREIKKIAKSSQCAKAWKSSRDLGYATKKARVEHLYAIAAAPRSLSGRAIETTEDFFGMTWPVAILSVAVDSLSEEGTSSSQ